MQLTPTQAQRAFIPLMVLAMSGVMSLVLTAVHAGIGAGFPLLWLRQWAVGFAVGLPAALLVTPLIRNGLARVTAPSSSVQAPHSPGHGHEPVTRASSDNAPDSRLSGALP